MESSEHPLPATAPAPYGERPLPEGPVHPGSGRRINWRKLWAPFAAIGALLVKVGAELKGLLLLLPKLKILTTSGSMLVSVAAYSLIWGWRFALGFVLLIFVHEMGHVIQLRREGIKASAPMFIPFLGAAIWAKSLGQNALAEARVGLVGFALLLGFMVVFPNPILLLILVIGGLDLWRRWQQHRAGEAGDYYRVSPRARVLVAIVYVGLVALLAFGMSQTHIERNFGDV